MDLTGHAREAFGWDGDVVLSAGPRGALGQIWRVDVGPASYALREIFRRPPPQAVIDAELEFSALASAAGVRLPPSHPDRAGRHLHRTPDGTWLRLYDWIDLRPADLSAPATPDALGTLLARLHRCAPAATWTEEDPWYHRVPAAHEWPATTAAWAPRLADRLASLPALCVALAPADRADLVVCHRDLHPGNVLAGPDGDLVVVDWDNLGPAAPARELARVLFDWCCDGPTVDLDAVHAIHTAYVREGGPGRITDPADFSMLLASRLNFLLVQLNIALDPHTEPRHRTWADREIDESLRILPTPVQLHEVLTMTRQTLP